MSKCDKKISLYCDFKNNILYSLLACYWMYDNQFKELLVLSEESFTSRYIWIKTPDIYLHVYYSRVVWCHNKPLNSKWFSNFAHHKCSSIFLSSLITNEAGSAVDPPPTRSHPTPPFLWTRGPSHIKEWLTGRRRPSLPPEARPRHVTP